MKLLYTFILSLLMTGGLTAQSILSLRLVPPNPSNVDTVYVLADLSFTSTGCNVSSLNHTQASNNIILASAHHCVGNATAICNITDTFNLGVMNQGIYDFNLTLTSGSGSMPCTPGIIPNDNDTITFTVVHALGLAENQLKNARLSPNPAENLFSIKGVQRLRELKIFAIDGATVMHVLYPKEQIDIEDLSPGIYIVQLSTNTELATLKLVKK